MKPITRGEVLGLAEYEQIRDPFRARVIEEKKRRRVALGPHATCIFENRDTVLLQIQEMLRTERISREAAVLHEIETYNDLIPNDHELSATIMIELDDRTERERFLVEARGLDRSFAMIVDGHRCRGKHDEIRENPDRTTAVHYVKFQLVPEARHALGAVLTRARRASSVRVSLVADHPRYTAKTDLPDVLVQELAHDLS